MRGGAVGEKHTLAAPHSHTVACISPRSTKLAASDGCFAEKGGASWITLWSERARERVHGG